MDRETHLAWRAKLQHSYQIDSSDFKIGDVGSFPLICSSDVRIPISILCRTIPPPTIANSIAPSRSAIRVMVSPRDERISQRTSSPAAPIIYQCGVTFTVTAMECFWPGASCTAYWPTLLASTQTKFRHSPSPRSLIAARLLGPRVPDNGGQGILFLQNDATMQRLDPQARSSVGCPGTPCRFRPRNCSSP